MKFLLNRYAERDDQTFVTTAREAGELITSHALADPSISAVVRVRDGVATVTHGPYVQSPEHVRAQHLLDCESWERAVELAALIAGGEGGGVEVRPLMDSAGMEL